MAMPTMETEPENTCIQVTFPTAKLHRLLWYCGETKVDINKAIVDAVNQMISGAVSRAVTGEQKPKRKSVLDELWHFGNPLGRPKQEPQSNNPLL